MEDEIATDVGTSFGFRGLKGISEALEGCLGCLGCLGCGVLRPLESWLLTAANNIWVASAFEKAAGALGEGCSVGARYGRVRSQLRDGTVRRLRCLFQRTIL